MATPTTGFIHGSDLLLGFYESTTFVALGHAKSCEIDNKADTKERATKEASNTGKWTEKGVNKLSVSISAEGFQCYEDTANAKAKLLELWEDGLPVTLRYAHRGEETTKYRTGSFIITNLKESAPADDDATYSVSFENSGPVTVTTV